MALPKDFPRDPFAILKPTLYDAVNITRANDTWDIQIPEKGGTNLTG